MSRSLSLYLFHPFLHIRFIIYSTASLSSVRNKTGNSHDIKRCIRVTLNALHKLPAVGTISASRSSLLAVCVCLRSSSKGSFTTAWASTWRTSPTSPTVWLPITDGFITNTTLTTSDRCERWKLMVFLKTDLTQSICVSPPGSHVPVCTGLKGWLGQHNVPRPGCCGNWPAGNKRLEINMISTTEAALSTNNQQENSLDLCYNLHMVASI